MDIPPTEAASPLKRGRFVNTYRRSPTTGRLTLEDLPVEILLLIFDRLEYWEVCRVSQANRYINDVTSSHYSLWRRVIDSIDESDNALKKNMVALQINLMRLRQEFQQSCDDLLQRFNETEQRRIHKEPSWRPPEYDQVNTTSNKDEHLEWPVSPKESCSSSSFSSASTSLDLPLGIEPHNRSTPLTIVNDKTLSILHPHKSDHESVSLTILSIPDICKQ
ncbi:hypothetical protein BGW37DRAFT_131424 [Umbelopsis sp. PMI_123]|nr:hypothetical protein BGW37DRAFT_131424 [Umbelopsis sp. PMI_123]